MNFAHPLAWLLLVLLVPVALLYRLRVGAPSQTVGTGLFWQKALAEEKLRWRWRRWRQKASLALQTLIVVLIALAAAGPQIRPSKRIALTIDNSATMRATDVKPRRLDEAKKVARRLIEGLRSCDEMAVVTMSPVSEIQPFTSDHALLRAAVDSVQATDESVRRAGTIFIPEDRLMQQLASQIPTRFVLITDACFKEGAKHAQQTGVEVLRVGTAARNLAITRFAARRSKPDPAKCEVLVEVRNQGDQSAQGTVKLTVSDKPADSTQFSIAKNGSWQHILALDLPAAAHLTCRIEPGDNYPFDDTAVLDLPAAPPAHRVKLAGEERSGLKEILAANRRVELIHDDTQVKAIQVIDGKTPETMPAGPKLIFTPGACDLWQLGDAVADPLVTRVDDSSPIMADVRFFDAYLPEARQLQIAASLRAVAKPILWTGTMPMGYAIDRPQGRVVVIGGDLATSNLPLQAAFPQLLAQALDWLDGQPPWKDEVIGSPLADWRGEPGGADIRVPNDIGADASALVVQKPWPPLWIVPAALAAVLVILEWCLYQRRWTN